MVKTSDQLKNMTEEFMKITGVEYKDNTEKSQEKNPQIDWQFVLGKNIIITVVKKRADRVNFLSALRFSENDQKGINQLLQDEPEFINSINELFVLKDCTHQWRKDKEGKITGINLNSYVDSEAYNRPNFFKELDKLILVQNHMSRKLGIKLNPKQVKPTDADTSEKSMYG